MILVWFALLVGFATPRVSAAQTLPQSALLPPANPLCDSPLVPCLDIDDLAAHAYAHFLILPATDQRGSGATIPYGISMGLFGRLAGGISSQTSLWSDANERFHSQGPLRLSATLLLWPLLPLRIQKELPATGDYGSFHVPPRGFRVGLTYDHEWRVGPFAGGNSLGHLTDLATVRLVGTKAMGPFELTASLGALVEPHTQYAVGEVAGKLGFYLPGIPALKLSLDAMARGVPATVRQDSLFALGEDSLRPQGAVGIGISYKPDARVDFGVSVQKGFGGIAPVAVSVRFLLVSVGKSYEGRAATSLTQLGTDAAVLGAERLKEAIEDLLYESPSDFPIDPKLDAECYIRDDDGSIMGKFGSRTPDGRFCEKDGAKVPIGKMLWRDQSSKRLCRDHKWNPRTKQQELTDCVLWRERSEWHPVHQTHLEDRCELRDEDGRLLGKLGTRSEDGLHCRYPVRRSNGGYQGYQDTQEQPIGGIFYTDKERRTVCETPNLSRCFLEAEASRDSLYMSNAERFARGADRGVESRIEGARKTGEAAEDLAAGRVRLTPIKEKLVEDLTETAQTVRDRDKLKEVAKRKLDDWNQSITSWMDKRMDDQLDDAGEFTANAAIDAAIGASTGTLGRTTGELAEGAEKIGKAGKRARQVEEGVAEHVQAPSVPARKSRGKNHLQPDPEAANPHSTFRRDAEGNMTNHAEWAPNRQNPSGFDLVKRVDLTGKGHPNPVTREKVPTPHVHDKTAPGGVRGARPDEIPIRSLGGKRE